MLTIEQIAAHLGVPKALAYGLVRVLEAKGVMKITGTQKKNPGTRGKPATTYQFAEDAALTFAEIMTALMDTATETATAEMATVVGQEHPQVEADKIVAEMLAAETQAA